MSLRSIRHAAHRPTRTLALSLSLLLLASASALAQTPAKKPATSPLPRVSATGDVVRAKETTKKTTRDADEEPGTRATLPASEPARAKRGRRIAKVVARCGEHRAGTACHLAGGGRGVCEAQTVCKGKRGCAMTMACVRPQRAAAGITNAELERRIGSGDRLTIREEKSRTSARHRRILTERPAKDPRLTRVARERAQTILVKGKLADDVVTHPSGCARRRAGQSCRVKGVGKGRCVSFASCEGDSCARSLRCEIRKRR